MGKYRIIVELGLQAGVLPQFVELIRVNAAASLREAGCRRFDIFIPSDNRVVLYEEYDDKSAFESHRRTEHFREFNDAAAALVTSRQITPLAALSDDAPGRNRA